MKRFSTNLILLLAVISISVNAQNWKQDKNHSKLGFAVTHLLVSEVQGSFKTFDVTVTSSKDDLSDAIFELSADIASVNTDVEGRDNDLRSEKFFDAAKFPKLTFKSTSFKKVEGNKYSLTGNLTIKDITKSITLDVVMNGPTPHPFNKKMMAGLKITGAIKRSDFAVGATLPVVVVSDEVLIVANGEIVKE